VSGGLIESGQQLFAPVVLPGVQRRLDDLVRLGFDLATLLGDEPGLLFLQTQLSLFSTVRLTTSNDLPSVMPGVFFARSWAAHLNNRATVKLSQGKEHPAQSGL
jgi:hypothetical protein